MDLRGKRLSLCWMTSKDPSQSTGRKLEGGKSVRSGYLFLVPSLWGHLRLFFLRQVMASSSFFFYFLLNILI